MKDHTVTSAQIHAISRHLSQPDLRARQITEHCDRLLALLLNLPDCAQGLFVRRLITMTEVQPEDRDTRFHELIDDVCLGRRWTKSGDDGRTKVFRCGIYLDIELSHGSLPPGDQGQ
jgi:hypothetical protein